MKGTMDMTKAVRAVFAVALLGSICLAAQAQESSTAVKPVTIKLGAFFPSNGDVKDAVGKTFFTAGTEYSFAKESDAMTQPLIYVDYAGKSKSARESDGETTISGSLRVSYVGVGAGIRAYSGSSSANSGRFYYGAGIGAYFTNAKLSLTASDSTGSSSGSDSKSKTNLGFRLNAGYEFSQGYLLEATYQYPGKVVDTNLSGFSILAGIRF